MKNIIVLITIFVFNFLFSQDSITDYYNEIAAHSEYSTDGVTSFTPKKWKTDIKIFVKGYDSIACSELIKVVSELNELIDSIEINIVDNESESNLIAFFGWFLDYDKLEPLAEPYTGSNHGLACLYPGTNDDFIKGSIYVDVVRCGWFPTEQSVILKKHLVREELTQALGLLNDSMKYPDSIFYEGSSHPIKFSELDVKIIKMHYN
jgi:hypothetical protein